MTPRPPRTFLELGATLAEPEPEGLGPRQLEFCLAGTDAALGEAYTRLALGLQGGASRADLVERYAALGSLYVQRARYRAAHARAPELPDEKTPTQPIELAQRLRRDSRPEFK